MKGRMYQVLTNNNDESTAEVVETFLYDKYGNVVATTMKVIDFSTDTYTTSYAYDHLNRTTTITYPNASKLDTTVSNVTLTSPNSYLIEASNSVTAGPTVLVQPGASLNLNAGTRIRLTAGFTSKNASSLRAKVVAAGYQVTYVYDQQGRISSIGTPVNSSYYATYAYNADGGIDKEILNSNSATYKRTNQFSYNDPRGRLPVISNGLFSEALTYSTGSYDNSGY